MVSTITIPRRRRVGLWFRRYWLPLWITVGLAVVIGFLTFWMYWYLFSVPYCWR